MPNTPKGLPYPTLTDAPNVPRDVRALADGVDAILDDYPLKSVTDAAAAATVSALAGKASTSHTHAGITNVKMVAGSVAVTMNSTGSANVTHGLGYAASGVIITGWCNQTGNFEINCKLYSPSINATQFQFRAFRDGGAPYVNAVAHIWFIVW